MMAYLPPDKSSGSSATPEPFPAGLTITAAKKTAAGVNLAGLCRLRGVPTSERGLDSLGMTFQSHAEEFVQSDVAFARAEEFGVFLGVFHFLSALVLFIFGLNHFYHLPVDCAIIIVD